MIENGATTLEDWKLCVERYLASTARSLYEEGTSQLFLLRSLLDEYTVQQWKEFMHYIASASTGGCLVSSW